MEKNLALYLACRKCGINSCAGGDDDDDNLSYYFVPNQYEDYEIRFILRIQVGRQDRFPNNYSAKQYLKMTSPFLSPCLYAKCSIYWKRPFFSHHVHLFKL